MLPAVFGHAQPVGQVQRELPGGDLPSELGEGGLRHERVADPLEALLPGVLAEVFEARALPSLRDEALGVEQTPVQPPVAVIPTA